MHAALSAVISGIASGKRTTVEAFRIAPALAIASWFSCLAMMAIPSLQVLTLQWVASHIQITQQNTSAPFPWQLLLAATLCALLIGLFSSTSRSLSQLLQFRLRQHYATQLTYALSGISPIQTVDPDFNIKVRAARDAVPFNLAWQATSTMTVVGSLFAMASLGISLWGISPLAAILVTFSLFPDLFVYSRVAGVENSVWPDQARISRRLEYLEQLQDYPPAATELASTIGTFHILDEASDAYRRLNRLMARPVVVNVRLSWLSSLAMGILIFLAFASIINTGGGYDVLFASLIGIISGLAVTRSAGSAIGELMASTPLISVFYDTCGLLSSGKPIKRVRNPVGYRLENISYAYPERTKERHQRRGIDSVSLDLRPGQTIGIIGPNGCGKTTLAKIIGGVLEPTDGRVLLIDADDRHSTTSEARLGSSSMVFQDFSRIEVTVRYFVDPTGTLTADRVDEALRRARAWDFVSSLPGGTDAQLGAQWGGVGLSGGQWQRLALARAFASEAPLWILDEPTAAIDADTEAAIYHDLTTRKPNDVTVVVVSHRPRTLSEVDVIVVMSEGRIVEHGSYRELAAAHGPFSRLLSDTLE